MGRLRHDLPITPGDTVSKKNTNNKEIRINLQFEKANKIYQQQKISGKKNKMKE